MLKKSNSKELKLLKWILWIYIILCIIIAGLNYGYAKNASPQTAEFLNWFWHFYENWIKTIFIIVCSILTIKIIGKSQRTKMRKKNLIGLIISALIVHIILPIILNNEEVYFFAMPLPWSTTPLQLIYPDSAFYQSRFPLWGASGISAVLVFFVIICIMIFVGTVILGRRWQCSTLCLFNGFAAEVFSPAFPLLAKGKKATPKTIKILSIIKWILLGVAIFFTLWWTLFLSGFSVFGNVEVLTKIELYKYLSIDLLMMMFLWVTFTGRGYCYYCPVGSVLSLISRVVGQKIKTDRTNCIQCGKCNQACPMSIDIKKSALLKQDVKVLRCVGCGHCVDACPTETLSYSTYLSK